jgi:hypothetical protein
LHTYSSFEFKPLYATIAEEGFHSFRVLAFENVVGDFEWGGR